MQRYHYRMFTCRSRSLLVVMAASALAWPAHADMEACINQAAQRYRVDERLIHAIIQVESSGNPTALNRNANGSEDIGLMQINSSWLPVLGRYGIKHYHLYDPCTNVHVGAWVLAGNIACRRHSETGANLTTRNWIHGVRFLQAESLETGVFLAALNFSSVFFAARVGARLVIRRETRDEASGDKHLSTLRCGFHA